MRTREFVKYPVGVLDGYEKDIAGATECYRPSGAQYRISMLDGYEVAAGLDLSRAKRKFLISFLRLRSTLRLPYFGFAHRLEVRVRISSLTRPIRTDSNIFLFIIYLPDSRISSTIGWIFSAWSRCEETAARTLTSKAFNSSFFALGSSVLSITSSTCL
jgi:hypothetical protein